MTNAEIVQRYKQLNEEYHTAYTMGDKVRCDYIADEVLRLMKLLGGMLN